MQFLVAMAELDRLETPMDEAASRDEIEAVHRAADEVMHRATTAYYIVRLESLELGSVAYEMLDAGQRLTNGALRWAAVERARATLNRLEEEAGTHLRHVHEALARLEEVAIDARVQRGRGREYWEAERHARRTLVALQRLTDEQINDLLDDAADAVDVIERIEKFHDAREAFLAAAQTALNAPPGALDQERYSVASPDAGQSPSTPPDRQPRTAAPSPGEAG
ncbi:hypothetical protein ACWC10_30690 [Streptomyces sp. NPDC001595]|uniref:hypothetical protein n=1 Tax=Streptomyces sp. NPDC001532 TaxID=3154520 RepID=UPI00332587DB